MLQVGHQSFYGALEVLTNSLSKGFGQMTCEKSCLDLHVRIWIISSPSKHSADLTQMGNESIWILFQANL